MGAHLPGKCRICGGRTHRTSATTCTLCLRSDSGTPRVPTEPASKITVSGDRADLVYTSYEPVKTLADLIRVCEIDISTWDIVTWVANKWDTSAKDDLTQKLVTRPLFQVKATMRLRVEVINSRAIIDAIVKDASKHIKPLPAPKSRRPAGLHMLELAVPDLHLGKLAHGAETMGANYDHKIAIDLYKKAIDALLQRTAAFRMDRIVIPFGNDLLHSDSKAGTTTAGTPLDNDSRYTKVFMEALHLLEWAVARARHFGPKIDLVAVPGNHDTLATFHLGAALEMCYKKTPAVTVHNQPTMRKYIEHGRVMLMFTHGNKGKLQNYPLLMATEQPEMFGRTRYREAHTGDKHQIKVQELYGVRVRISPALCPPDAWHYEHHFVCNQRAAEGFVWSPSDGLVSLAVYTVPEEE